VPISGDFALRDENNLRLKTTGLFFDIHQGLARLIYSLYVIEPDPRSKPCTEPISRPTGARRRSGVPPCGLMRIAGRHSRYSLVSTTRLAEGAARFFVEVSNNGTEGGVSPDEGVHFQR
jgi:hypothetical protein